MHRGVEWCLYGPQTPRETRDTRIFRTTLHVLGPVNRAKRRPERARSGSGTPTIQEIKIVDDFFKNVNNLTGWRRSLRMGSAKLKPPRRRCPNLKIVILPDCAQLIRHKSACGRSGDQGSQGEPPRSLGGLYAAVGAPARSYRGSTIIPWPLPPPLALSTIFRRFSADVAVLPTASLKPGMGGS